MRFLGGLGKYAKSAFVIKKFDINQIVVSSNAILEWLILASVSI